jgi:hypothetical protein
MSRLIGGRLLIVMAAMHLCAAIACADNAAAKLPPPDAGVRAHETRMVDDVYKEQIAKARTVAEKTALAVELIRLAGESKDKTAEQFALFSKASEIAAQAGDAATAVGAIDRLSERFQVDALAMHLDVLARLSTTLKQTSEQKAFIEHCDAAMEDAILQERYDLVKRVSDLEIAAARKYGDAASLKAANARSAETRAAHIAFDKQKAALAALARNPADPEANLTVGKYQCFSRNDWKSGLPFLARSGDAALKSLAEKELAASGDAQAKAALADGWWDRAAKEQGLAQKHVHRRAAMLYNEALPSLTGLTKTKAEKRIATLTVAGIPFSARAMTLDEIMTRFTFPNKSFHIAGDAVTGNAENYDDATKYVWLENPETMQSLEFGLAMKAKNYRAAVVEIDGRRYRFTQGFQGVNDCMIDISGIRGERYPMAIKNQNDWISIKGVVDQNKVTYFLNGALVGSCDVQTPMTKSSKIRIGFSSHGTPISVKDVYLVEK